MDIANGLMQLFAGFQKAHGTYRSEERREGRVKAEIKSTARTVREPVTLEIWQNHLIGNRPIGIIPIDERNMCQWGAIDVDQYDINHADLVKELVNLKVPGFVGRTKSGGAHIYLFFKQPIAAKEVTARLRELAAALGYATSEIFPKQDVVLLERGDLGNWLNMPYYGDDQTERYVVQTNGLAMTSAEFVEAALASRMTLEQFRGLHLRKQVTEFLEGPPCLETLAATGVTEGQRNNALFNFGVLAKKMDATQWEGILSDWNKRYVTPSLESTEFAGLIKTLRRKEYLYKCHDEPIKSCCNMPLCRTRKFGIGPGDAISLVEGISILDTDPPIFFVALKTGGTVECDAPTLLDNRAFQRAVLGQQKIIIPLFKHEVWLRQVEMHIQEAKLIEASPEIGRKGIFAEYLEKFCTDRYAAKHKDEILLGKPYRSIEEKVVYFRLKDVQDFFAKGSREIRDITRGQLTTRIRDIGGESEFVVIKNRGINIWKIPDMLFNWRIDDADIPRSEEGPL